MSRDVHSCTQWLRPRNSPLPRRLDSYSRALLVSQDGRHLFVTPCAQANFTSLFCSSGLHHLVWLMWTSPRGFTHVDFTMWFCSCRLSTWFYSFRLHHVVLLMYTSPRGFAHVDFTTRFCSWVISTWFCPWGLLHEVLLMSNQYVVLSMGTSPRGFAHEESLRGFTHVDVVCLCGLHHVVLPICTWPRASVLDITVYRVVST